MEHTVRDGVQQLVAFGTALLLAFTLAQSPDPPLVSPSLVLRCGEGPGEVMLSIHNPNETDTAILLGVSLANGRWYLPRELVVELRRNGNPAVEELVFRGPSAIAGRMDHWVVTLRVRSTFTHLRLLSMKTATRSLVGIPTPQLYGFVDGLNSDADGRHRR